MLPGRLVHTVLHREKDHFLSLVRSSSCSVLWAILFKCSMFNLFPSRQLWDLCNGEMCATLSQSQLILRQNYRFKYLPIQVLSVHIELLLFPSINEAIAEYTEKRNFCQLSRN